MAMAARLSRAMGRAGGHASTLAGERRGSRTVLLQGDERAFARLLRSPLGDDESRRIACEIDVALRFRDRPAPALRLKRGRLKLGGRTRVMGILNLTPDSFSDGGRFASTRLALDAALRMVDEGADIIDVGGESTRPGSHPVPLDEELRRVIPLLKKTGATPGAAARSHAHLDRYDESEGGATGGGHRR